MLTNKSQEEKDELILVAYVHLKLNCPFLIWIIGVISRKKETFQSMFPKGAHAGRKRA